MAPKKGKKGKKEEEWPSDKDDKLLEEKMKNLMKVESDDNGEDVRSASKPNSKPKKGKNKKKGFKMENSEDDASSSSTEDKEEKSKPKSKGKGKKGTKKNAKEEQDDSDHDDSNSENDGGDDESEDDQPKKTVPIVHLEDVYITGLCAASCHLRREHNKGFKARKMEKPPLSQYQIQVSYLKCQQFFKKYSLLNFLYYLHSNKSHC